MFNRTPIWGENSKNEIVNDFEYTIRNMQIIQLSCKFFNDEIRQV